MKLRATNKSMHITLRRTVTRIMNAFLNSVVLKTTEKGIQGGEILKCTVQVHENIPGIVNFVSSPNVLYKFQ